MQHNKPIGLSLFYLDLSYFTGLKIKHGSNYMLYYDGTITSVTFDSSVNLYCILMSLFIDRVTGWEDGYINATIDQLQELYTTGVLNYIGNGAHIYIEIINE